MLNRTAPTNMNPRASHVGDSGNMTSNSLTCMLCAAGRLIHDPKARVPRSHMRRAVGTMAAFCTSGIMHELMFL